MLSGDMSPGISRRTKTADERIISLYFQQLLCLQLSISNFRKAVTKYFINSSLLYNSPKWFSLLDSKFFFGILGLTGSYFFLVISRQFYFLTLHSAHCRKPSCIVKYVTLALRVNNPYNLSLVLPHPDPIPNNLTMIPHNLFTI